VKRGRQKNAVWGFVAVAGSLFLLLRAMELVPDGLDDLFLRGWPVLLVFVGLAILLGERIPWANIAALGVSTILAVGIVVVAYSSRSSQYSDAQQVAITETVSEVVTLLVVHVTTLDTDVTITVSSALDGSITGQFIGSMQSKVTIDYIENAQNGVAEFSLIEMKFDQLPALEDVGRGRLVLEIPPGLPVAVALVGEDGNVLLDVNDLSLERLNFDVHKGNVRVMLPEYQPRSSNAAEEPGQLVVSDGDLTVLILDTVDVQLAFDRHGNRTDPQYPASYIEVRYGVDGMLRRSQETSAILYMYEVVIPHGLLSLQLVDDES
jgi:hypothetical protein